jgi:hypothetical protein
MTSVQLRDSKRTDPFRETDAGVPHLAVGANLAPTADGIALLIAVSSYDFSETRRCHRGSTTSGTVTNNLGEV